MQNEKLNLWNKVLEKHPLKFWTKKRVLEWIGLYMRYLELANKPHLHRDILAGYKTHKNYFTGFSKESLLQTFLLDNRDGSYSLDLTAVHMHFKL